MARARLIALAMTAALVALPPSFAQDEAAPNPCESDARYAAFDFWVGDWEVFDEAGAKLGENSVTREEGGCLVVERWASARGTTGQSYNYYDPAEDHWRQLWVSAGEIIDYTGGVDADGAMRLEGTLTPRAGGAPLPFRGAWAPLDEGAVRQSFELRDADSGEWSTWFVGIYRPKD